MGIFLPVFLCFLARPKAPLVWCPSGPLCFSVLALSSIPLPPMVALPSLSLTSPKFVSSGPSSGFPMYLPNFPNPVIGSSSSTLRALNVSHKFWNFSKTEQLVSDVSGLPKKTKLFVGVPSA